jgi:hypothetical protein
MSNSSCDARLKLFYAIYFYGSPRSRTRGSEAEFDLCETSFILRHGTLSHIQLIIILTINSCAQIVLCDTFLAKIWKSASCCS